MQRCVGAHSCLLNACSGHGLCQQDNISSSAASSLSSFRCVCDAHFYGADCSLSCSEAGCTDAYGVAGLTCSPEGACRCPEHFTSLTQRCSACEDGWYGVLCEVPCPCSGHGGCDRVSGVCVCFADDVRGYWDGASCSQCASAYMGDRCTRPNARFTQMPDAVLSPTFPPPLNGAQRSDAVTLQWNGTRQLVVSRGAAILCGEVHTGTENNAEKAQFVAAGPARIAPRVVRSSTIFANGTVALLAAGPKEEGATTSPLSSSFSSGGTGGSALGVSVLHGMGDPLTNACVFTEVEDVNATFASTVTAASSSSSGTHGDDAVVDALISEKWGWAVLWSDGSLFLQHRRDTSLSLPTDFTATSLYLDNSSGLAFVLGAFKDGRWAVYATHSSDASATRLVEVNFTSVAGREEVVTRTGVAWQVYVSGTEIYVAGWSASSPSSSSSGNRIWLLCGHLTSLVDLAGVEVSTLTTSSTPSSGEPLTFSLLGSVTGNITSLLCVVQTNVDTRTFAWVVDTSSEVPQLFLRNSQSVAAAVDAATPLRAAYIAANGLLLLYQPGGGDVVAVRPFTGYSITSVYPPIIDASGGTAVTLRGIFLAAGMHCLFGNETTPAELINATALQCTPPARTTADVCTPLRTDVSMPGIVFATAAAATKSGLLLQRYLTFFLTSSVGGDTQGSYTSVNSRLPITVFGQGFVNTSLLHCLYMDPAMMAFSEGHYISSQQIECDFPTAVTSPSYAAAGTLSVSMDNRVFASPLSFTFVGAAARLVAWAPSELFEVASAAYVALPLVHLFVVDVQGHVLRELDVNSSTGFAVERVVTMSMPWFNSTRMEVSSPINPARSVVALAYTNKTVNGSTAFSVFLQYPLVGVGLLRFSADGLEPAEVMYTVREGEPYAMEVAVQPSPLLSSHYANASRQPVVVFRDVAGNAVGSWSALLKRAISTVGVVFFDGVAWRQQSSQAVSRHGYYNFTGIHPRGFFGSRYRMLFVADGFGNVSSDEMRTSNCYADEYGRYDTTLCLPCPAHATCNGSHVFNITDGYWKGGELAYDIYACPRPRVCRGGACAAGYAGVLCAVCDDGYGRTGSQCVRCFSVAANVVLVVLLVVFVVLAPLALLLLTFEVFGPRFRVVHGARAFVDLLQMVGLVLLPMPELPDYVERFVVFTQLISTGNVLDVSPIDCLFARLDATTKFVIGLVAVLIVFFVLLAILLYSDVVFARHLAEQRKRRWFLRLLAPFPSEEAYHNRLVELGLDEERALGGAVAAAETLDPAQKTIRESYALIDSNRYAIAAVRQLPTSAVRESALESLLEEQEELRRFLRQYEEHVSRGAAAAAATTVAAATAPPRPSLPGRDGAESATRLSPTKASDFSTILRAGAADGEPLPSVTATTAASAVVVTTTTTSSSSTTPPMLIACVPPAAQQSPLLTVRDPGQAYPADGTAAAATPLTSSEGDTAVIRSNNDGGDDKTSGKAKAAEEVEELSDQRPNHSRNPPPPPSTSSPSSSPEPPPPLPSPVQVHSAAAVADEAVDGKEAEDEVDRPHDPQRLRLPRQPPQRRDRRTGSGVSGGVGSVKPGRRNRDVDSSSPTAAAAAAAALQSFDDITPTPFCLFGAQEPFRPTATPLHYLHPQLLPATEQVAPQRQSMHTAATFPWPRLRAQLVFLCFTVYDYFYVFVVELCFALVRCESTTISRMGTAAGESESALQVASYRTLAADHRVSCQRGDYNAYRVAGIVLGSLYSTAVPLGLMWLSFFAGQRGTAAYVRDCCLAILGLGEHFLWWGAIMQLFKLALVLIRDLVPSKNVAGLVMLWTVLSVCTFLIYIQPYYNFFPQSLQAIAYLVLTLTATMQLVPLLYSATMDNGVAATSVVSTAAQQASGVLVVALPCVALAALLFIVWAAVYSQQRWCRLGGVLFALGGGVEVHNILHFLHRRRTETAATSGTTSFTSKRALSFSFAGYNMQLVRRARRGEAADGSDDSDSDNDKGRLETAEATLEEQMVQAVRGKAAYKGSRRGKNSLWTNWSVVGGLIGMANHVFLLSRFIRENEGAVPGEAVLAAATAKESSRRADAALESVVRPLVVMDCEAGEELLTMCEHLRQLEHFVLQMEKALERRTEN